MILGVDVGGTKTLLGLFNPPGDLKKKHRLLTNQDYPDFLEALAKQITSFTAGETIEQICLAMPGRIERSNGSVVAMGHRPWQNVAITNDLAKLLPFKAKIHVENDANLAGLAEAQHHKKHKVVVYITISTGVGTGILVDQKLDPNFLDSEGGFLLQDVNGQFRQWDSYESGSAIFEHYHELASEIDDPRIWDEISRHLTPGFSAIIALLQPEVIVVGGSVGVQFKKFEPMLNKYLANLPTPLISLPVIVPAKFADESVLYGCYQLAKQFS